VLRHGLLTVVEPERTLEALESFRLRACEGFLLMIDRDVSWKAMLGKAERDATDEKIAPPWRPSTGGFSLQMGRGRPFSSPGPTSFCGRPPI
jgi:hypothetical protein